MGNQRPWRARRWGSKEQTLSYDVANMEGIPLEVIEAAVEAAGQQ